MNIEVKDFVCELTNDIKRVTPKRNRAEIISSDTKAVCKEFLPRKDTQAYLCIYISFFLY